MESKRNIMIVDDSSNNLQVLRDILEQANYAVRPAISGEMALHAIASFLPDLILLDIRMPHMDGYEVCKRILGNPQTRHIPIVFISALDDIEDKLTAFRAGAVDYITKPFQPEEVLARVNTQIELFYARKSLIDTNQQLHALMDQLVQAEKLKSLGSLAAGVAHELNTPIGNAVLTASALDASVREFMQTSTATQANTDISQLISSVNDCSKLILRNLARAGNLVHSLREVAVDQTSERRRSVVLRECVDDVIATMKFATKKTPYRISNTIPPELTLETFPGRLEQIFENLINNAIIHGFAGKNEGCITFSAQLTTKEQITIEVCDNGNGIPAENLKRVFDPFFTSKLGQGGSGLGLHIVYTLVSGALGGSIQVQSNPGSGTTFTLKLPLIAPVRAAAVD